MAKHGLTFAMLGRGLRRQQKQRWNAKRGKREPDSKYRKKKTTCNWRTWRTLKMRRLCTKTSLQADRDYTTKQMRKGNNNNNFTRLPWRKYISQAVKQQFEGAACAVAAESAVEAQRAARFLSRAKGLCRDVARATSEPRKDLALVVLAGWVTREGESLVRPEGA